jgi:uncharacterized protein YkwD
MRLVAPVAALAALALVTPAAEAGAPIKKLPSCEHAYLFPFSEATPKADFRDGLLCLINAVRKSQHLPALKRNAKLESVAQAQSDKFQRTGSGSHGNTLAEIGKRFEKKGYKPAAYNEAFALANAPASPYGLLVAMMRTKTVPCTEILDPRFRDIGIGFTTGGFVTTAALEFGLKRGAKQPSNDYSKALSCPHKVPAPLLTAPPIDGAEPLPMATGDTVRAGMRCIGKLDCEVSAEMTLDHAKATSKLPAGITIPAGQSVTLSFTFDPAAIQSELSAAQPSITLHFTVTKPSQYSDVLNGPLRAG